MKRTRQTIHSTRWLPLALVVVSLAPASAFLPPSVPALTNRAKPFKALRSAIPDESEALLLSSSSSSENKGPSWSSFALPQNKATLLGTPAFVLWAASTLSQTALAPTAAPTPVVASEILTDLSHVALDLVTLWGPSAVVVRLFAVIGRIFSVLADYLPDHSMHPEEVIFQSAMIFVAVTGLIQGLLPQLQGHLLAPAPTFRSGKAYHRLGKPAGMTWTQWKALTVDVLEWTELGPNDTIQNTVNCSSNSANHTTLFWLYKGDIRVQRKATKETRSHLIHGTSNGRLRQIDGAQHVDLASFQSTIGTENNNGSSTVLQAGTEGATLLVCHLERLAALIRHDANLKDVWKVILWQGLQDQLADAYDEDGVTT